MGDGNALQLENTQKKNDKETKQTKKKPKYRYRICGANTQQK